MGTHSTVQAKEPSNLEQLRLELDREIASLGSQSVMDTSKAAAASTLLAALPKKKYKKTKQEKLEDEPWKSQLEPLWGLKHNPSADVVMALGFGYSQREFARFVSTLRRTEYKGDIVLAAGPPEKFKRGVVEYLRGEGVLAYQFSYECVKAKKGRRLLMTPAGCVLTNWYKDGDKRSPSPLDTHWKIKDKDGWILDYNGERSAVVHQWDRFHSECVRHVL